jgi:Flp pilus assembly protein CpaB
MLVRNVTIAGSGNFCRTRQMKTQSIIMLCVALCCGLIAMLGVRQVLLRQGGNAEEVVQIVRASVDVEAGVPLTSENVELVGVPVSLLPKGVLTSLDNVKERALKARTQAGEWILANKLGEKGQFGVMVNIPNGWAVVTIPVDGTTTHSGMLRPGNLIDLLVTYRDPAAKNDFQKTITVLEFVEVFAVDDQLLGDAKDGEKQARNITLLVSPEQAKAVTLAGNVGKLSTVLRKPGSSDESLRSRGIATEFRDEWFGQSNLGAPKASANAELPPADLDIQDFLAPGADAGLTEDKRARSVRNKQSVAETEGMDEEVLTENEAAAAEPKRSEEMWTIELHGGNKIRREQILLKKR